MQSSPTFISNFVLPVCLIGGIAWTLTQFPSGTQFSCTRSNGKNGVCQIVHFFVIRSEKQTLELSSIQQADLLKTVTAGRNGVKNVTYQIRLLTTKGNISLPIKQSSINAIPGLTVDKINQFITSNEEVKFEVSDHYLLFPILITFVLSLILLGWIQVRLDNLTTSRSSLNKNQ